MSNMPFKAQIWVIDESPSDFTVLIDKKLISKRGAALLAAALTANIGASVDATFVRATLRAITG